MRVYRYTVSKEVVFSAAHFLRQYHGGCEQLHGHNYRVRIYAAADELDSEGMVVDFVQLKASLLASSHTLFDHRCINEVPPFDEINPTTEHLARFIGDKVAAEIDNERVRITECHVWETEGNCAIYRR